MLITEQEQFYGGGNMRGPSKTGRQDRESWVRDRPIHSHLSSSHAHFILYDIDTWTNPWKAASISEYILINMTYLALMGYLCVSLILTGWMSFMTLTVTLCCSSDAYVCMIMTPMADTSSEWSLGKCGCGR